MKINEKYKSVTLLKSKEIYKSIIRSKSIVPTAIERWIHAYPFLEALEWSSFYNLPFQLTTEPHLQSFQYKIFNRIINCRDKLFTWKIAINNKCEYCEQIDTLEHHFYYCVESQKIWNAVEKWMINNLEFSFKLKVCEVLLGIPYWNENNNYIILNFMILIGKKYINSLKAESSPIFFVTYLSYLRDKLEVVMKENQVNNRRNVEWQDNLWCLL